MKLFIQLNQKDNVAIALTNLNKGTVIDIHSTRITLKEDVKFGHKIAIADIKQGQNVKKYGLPIGKASVHISEGEHVHIHNLESNYTGNH